MKNVKIIFCLFFAVALIAYSPFKVKAFNTDFHNTFKKEVNKTVCADQLNVSFEVKSWESGNAAKISNVFRKSQYDIVDNPSFVNIPSKPIRQLNYINSRLIKGKAKVDKPLQRYFANERFFKNSLE